MPASLPDGGHCGFGGQAVDQVAAVDGGDDAAAQGAADER
jgi:hypothetical protein